MSEDIDRYDRRSVLKTTGAALTALGGLGAATTPTAALPPLTVHTRSATDVGTSSATLNGYLEYLGDNDYADVWFDWGPVGDGLPNSTPRREVSTTGPFSAEITNLASGTYEFRAVAQANVIDYDEGDVLTFRV